MNHENTEPMNDEISESNRAQVLGDKIKALRLGKNYTIEDLSKETLVSLEVIQGIETGKYDNLPALAYSSGQLTNVLEKIQVSKEQTESTIDEFEACYRLETNSEDNRFSSIKKRKGSDEGDYLELPNMDSFSKTERNKRNLSLLVLGGIIVLSVLGLLLYYFYQENLLRLTQDIQIKIEQEQVIDENKGKETFNFYEASATYTLGKNDEVKVFFENRIFVFKLDEIDYLNEPKLKLTYNGDKVILLSLFQEMKVALKDDKKKDLLIKFQQVSGELAIVYFSYINNNLKNTDYAQIWNQQEKLRVGEEEFFLTKNQEKSVIVSYVKATSLPIYLSYNIDGQRQNTIQLKPGNHISIVAQEHLEVQIGNFRSAQLVINRIPIQLEVDGDQFSVTKIVKWVPSSNNETRSDLMIKNFIN